MAPSLLDLPLELRLSIWTSIVQPDVVYPCECAEQAQRCQPTATSATAAATTYTHCDNRILLTNRQIYAEVRPLIKERLFVLGNATCLDGFFQALNQRDWKWVRHLRLTRVFVGHGREKRDDWFLWGGQSQRWVGRFVKGKLERYIHGDGRDSQRGRDREVVIRVAEGMKEDEDEDGTRTVVVDIDIQTSQQSGFGPG